MRRQSSGRRERRKAKAMARASGRWRWEAWVLEEHEGSWRRVESAESLSGTLEARGRTQAILGAARALGARGGRWDVRVTSPDRGRGTATYGRSLQLPSPVGEAVEES